MSDHLRIGSSSIAQGERKRIHLEAPSLYDYSKVTIPVEVIRGKKQGGPVLFVSAALHGDEINGVEVIRRLIKPENLKGLQGTLIAVPVVNVYGFNTKSRYLPDRRDLNRCFPGSKSGSLGAQLAHLFMTEIVSKATHGVDLHTGAIHRSNLPQIRAFMEDKQTATLAKAFKAPVIINSSLRDGSLREAAREADIPMLLFEGGEALRYEEKVIQGALQGILSVMAQIGMVRRKRGLTLKKQPIIAQDSHWIRAPYSGTLIHLNGLGDAVEKGQTLAIITDPFGDHQHEVKATEAGVIIGQTELPLVNGGDAIFHIATFSSSRAMDRIEKHLDEYDALYEDDASDHI